MNINLQEWLFQCIKNPYIVLDQINLLFTIDELQKPVYSALFSMKDITRVTEYLGENLNPNIREK